MTYCEVAEWLFVFAVMAPRLPHLTLLYSHHTTNSAYLFIHSLPFSSRTCS
uniref:Uncharacterized protein n=1 Tax=Arundo donax TaxID=35708 RepID=A0A0A8ZZI2_ARUDO